MKIDTKCISIGDSLIIKRNSYTTIYIILLSMILLIVYSATIVSDMGLGWSIFMFSFLLFISYSYLQRFMFPIQTKIDLNKRVIFMRGVFPWAWQPICEFKPGLKELYISTYDMKANYRYIEVKQLCIKNQNRQYIIYDSIDDSAITMKEYLLEQYKNKMKAET